MKASRLPSIYRRTGKLLGYKGLYGKSKGNRGFPGLPAIPFRKRNAKIDVSPPLHGLSGRAPDRSYALRFSPAPLSLPFLSGRLPLLRQEKLGFGERGVVQPAEVGKVLPLPWLQRLDQHQVGPGSHLLNNYEESVPELPLMEHAELLQPLEVREDLLEVSIQSEESLVDGEASGRVFHRAAPLG